MVLLIRFIDFIDARRYGVCSLYGPRGRGVGFSMLTEPVAVSLCGDKV